MDSPLRVGEKRGVPQGTSKEQSDQGGGLGPGGVFSVSRIADCWGKLQALVTNPGPRHRSEILVKEFYQVLQRLSTDKCNGGHTSGGSGT